jgi:oligopeptide/dipeptide ABC transporter ATP-binding protein
MGIVGESGCGKSVMALSVMGLLAEGVGKVVKGEILFEGGDILRYSERKRNALRGNRISIIFQEPMSSFNPIMKIGELMTGVIRKHLKMRKKAAWAYAVQLLADVGIPQPEEIIRRYPHELSGGMLQRVMIATGMSCSPKILIADEPTTALDVTIQAQILKLMLRLRETRDMSVLLITHNLDVVGEICDRVCVMYAGHVVEQSGVREIFANPLHPYTRGLMQCAPKPEESRRRLDAIKGAVPPLNEMPPGCRFAPRCAVRIPRCLNSRPVLAEIEDGHYCRCHKHMNRAAGGGI